MNTNKEIIDTTVFNQKNEPMYAYLVDGYINWQARIPITQEEIDFHQTALEGCQE